MNWWRAPRNSSTNWRPANAFAEKIKFSNATVEQAKRIVQHAQGIPLDTSVHQAYGGLRHGYKYRGKFTCIYLKNASFITSYPVTTYILGDRFELSRGVAFRTRLDMDISVFWFNPRTNNWEGMQFSYSITYTQSHITY